MGKAVTVLVMFVSVFVVLNVVNKMGSNMPAPATTTTSLGTPAPSIPAPSTPTNPYLALTPAKIIEQGRALDKRWKAVNSGKSPEVIFDPEIDQTREALHSITSTEPEFKDAQHLLAALDQDEATANRLQKIAKDKADKQAQKDAENTLEIIRRAFAQTLEQQSLEAGFSVDVTTSGPKDTILTYKYALVGKAFVYKVGHDGDFLQRCHDMGFTRVVFSDGYDQDWFYDLTKM